MQFSDKVYFNILKFLDDESLKNCMLVCRKFYDIVRTFKKTKDELESNFCSFHSIKFKTFDSFKTHMLNKHNIIIESKTANLFCETCNAKFNFNFQRVDHLLKEHNIYCEVIEKSFNSFEDFEQWKKDEEISSSSCFVQTSSSKSSKIYGCNRNPVTADYKRNINSREIGKRNIKTSGYRY